MVKVSLLRNMTGVRKFALCTSCGKPSTKDPEMIRITVTRDDESRPRTETAVLCGRCAGILRNRLTAVSPLPSVTRL